MSYLPCRRRGATTGVRSRGRAIDRRRSRGARTTDRSNQHVLDWASYNGPDVGDEARRGATDQTGDRSTCVDRMHRGPPMINNARGVFKEL